MTSTPWEAKRLAALRSYKQLDTPPERDFDELAKLAAFVCQVPIALVVLLDRNRQWFKAKHGLSVCETPRDQAFCAHAIRQTEIMVVHDARCDPRFSDNPLVTGDPFIRFYAGAPLITPTGDAIGTLCVIDRVPRTLTSDQLLHLRALAHQVSALFEARKAAGLLAEALEQVDLLNSLLPICGYCREVRDDRGYWQRVEDYMAKRGTMKFTHGICPRCVGKHFPDVADAVAAEAGRKRPDAAAGERREK
jgi:GAF domain-containing protein